MIPSPPTDFNASLSVGPLISCSTISAFLFGVSTVQTYLFYRNFPKDRFIVKCLVGILWILELVHATFVSIGVYQCNVNDFGKPATYNSLSSSFIVTLLTSVFIYVVVVILLTHRLRILSGIRWLHLVCWAVVIARNVLLLVSVGLYFPNPWITVFVAKHYALISVTLAMFSISDLVVAGLLTYTLWTKRGIGLPSSANILDKLIVWTAQTGLLTAVVTITLMITFIVMPYSSIWLGLTFILPRVYTNTLLASLNGRITLQEIGQQYFDEAADVQASEALSSPTKANHPQIMPITIEMRRSISVVRDGESEVAFTAGENEMKKSSMSVE